MVGHENEDSTQAARLMLFPEVARLAQSPLLQGYGTFIIAAPADPMAYVFDRVWSTPNREAVLVMPHAGGHFVASMRGIAG